MITFHVPGKVVPKARARSTRNGHHYTPEKTRTYEGLVRSAAMAAYGMRPPLASPVKLTVVIALDIPSAWPLWKARSASEGGVAATTKPDTDNCLKSIKDALNGVIWFDDAQVVQIEAQKIYSTNPGALITVQFLDAMPAQQKTKPGAAA
ncbi:MAG: RusA family crossover junction endodeoxyribonuclease [Hahellaceae bacterium]|nr:RusA family crossover junction endodeoxyribonuclease [Hahellaceae bacterium]